MPENPTSRSDALKRRGAALRENLKRRKSGRSAANSEAEAYAPRRAKLRPALEKPASEPPVDTN